MQTDIVRPQAGLPIFRAEGRDRLFLRAGAQIAGADSRADAETEIALPEFAAGTDYLIRSDAGALVVAPAGADLADAIGGFHFAPGDNASARAGGDDAPAINPFSIWDAGFRPACDPRGMALVDLPDGRRLWVDIYLLGTDHLAQGTSRHGATIADGHRNKPKKPDGSRHDGLDFLTAVDIYAGHGKRLLTYDEFRAAAFGVTEKSSADDKPETAGLDAARTSRFGLMQATGNLWVWGTDGDPDDPRPSLFGGSWLSGQYAGSRYADLDSWPDYSVEGFSARGCRDHES
ncbi:MAG: hypothetical protein J0H53_05470 [Rhizobiales bacterium]|nr:hypothetical protein [Hyphomicrobiales bacterium]OJU37149.1 MAG: hypothetical protein BGN94_08145 [Rhizobiales bacterium 68-8]